MNQERLWGRSFMSLCASVFFLFLTNYTLVSTLSIYAVDRFEATKPQVGLIVTAFAIPALISRLVAGPWMKRYGERRVYLTAATIYFVASSLFLFSSSLGVVLLLRAVQGFTAGIGTSAGGTIAALLVPKRRTGEGLGYYATFMSLAMVIGPWVGLTVIQSLPFTVLFLCGALFAALSVATGLLVATPKAQASAAAESAAKATGWRAILEPAAIPISLCGLLLAFSYSGLSAFASVYGTSLGLTRFTSYFFAVYAILDGVPRPILGRVFDKVGANAVIYPGIVLYVLGQFFLSGTSTGFGYLGSAAVLGIGYGALFPSFMTLAVQSAPTSRKGYATSTYYFFIDVGIACGSLLLGLVAGYSNYHVMYLVSGSVMALALPLYFVLHHRPRGGKI